MLAPAADRAQLLVWQLIEGQGVHAPPMLGKCILAGPAQLLCSSFCTAIARRMHYLSPCRLHRKDGSVVSLMEGKESPQASTDRCQLL